MNGIVFDIDGTILRGDMVLPAVRDVLALLRQQQIKLAFLTNDNRLTVDAWLSRFAALDLDIRPNELLTSAIISAETIAHRHPNQPVLLFGADGLREAAHVQQLVLNDDSAEIVLMGKDPTFDQTKLNLACQAIWDGATFYATNNDRKMPIAAGYIPATGAMVQAVAYATGVQPIVTGKPSIYAAKVVLDRMGVSAENTIIVGDSLTSDIALGKTAGMKTILVLTGTHKVADVEQLPPDKRPDHIIETLNDLTPILFGETP